MNAMILVTLHRRSQSSCRKDRLLDRFDDRIRFQVVRDEACSRRRGVPAVVGRFPGVSSNIPLGYDPEDCVGRQLGGSPPRRRRYCQSTNTALHVEVHRRRRVEPTSGTASPGHEQRTLRFESGARR